MRRLESQRGDLATKQGQQWLTWIVGIGFTVMLAGLAALLTLMLYLHGNTNERLDRIEQRIESRFEKMEAEMKEIKELLQRK